MKSWESQQQKREQKFKSEIEASDNSTVHYTVENLQMVYGTLCIRKKGKTSLHTLNTLWTLRQTVFPRLHQNVERCTVRGCQHIVNGLGRR